MSDGFVEGAGKMFRAKGTSSYQNKMNGANFEEWLTENLLPQLLPHSVMGNAPHQCVKEGNVPYMSSLKTETKDWLTQEGTMLGARHQSSRSS